MSVDVTPFVGADGTVTTLRDSLLASAPRGPAYIARAEHHEVALAGCFQFTTLKRGCLTVCSHPGGFFLRYYRRGVGNALALGVRYGLVCLGCCWALMILLVIVGGGSLYLMVALTAIMFAERALGWGDRFVAIVGLTCIVLGVLIAVSPTVVPAFAQNAERWAAMESQQTSNHRGLPCPHSRGHWLACQRVCGE